MEYGFLSGNNSDHLLRTIVDYASGVDIHNGNPRVGAVLITPTGKCFYGRHEGGTSAHAEVDALRKVQQSFSHPQEHLRGATMMVTLEPCSHQGKNPPCTQAIIDSGISTLIYAVKDPFPLACGGAEVLRKAGIHVISAEEVCGQETVSQAYELTRRWRTAIIQQRPWCYAKIAQTADGYVAARDGTSQWITSSLSRAYSHQLRAHVDAIIVGTGTVLADNPHLTARLPQENSYQPHKIVVGYRRIPHNYHIWEDTRTDIYQTRCLHKVMERLWDKNYRSVLIEGGPTIISAALKAGLVNELHMYIAPCLLGAGKKSVSDLSILTLRHALYPREISMKQLEDNVVMQLVYSADPARPQSLLTGFLPYTFTTDTCQQKGDVCLPAS